jgi:subtilisin family serine protease
VKRRGILAFALAFGAGFILLASASAQALGSSQRGDGLWSPGDAPGTVLVTFRPGISREDLKAEAKRLGLDEDSSGPKIQGALHRALGGQVDLDLPQLGLQRVRLVGQDKAHVDSAILSYRSSALVLAAEPDHPISAASISITVNDTLYTGGQQWGLTNTSWPQAVAAYNAGSISLIGTVTVAVIDSGVDAHSDLSGQVLPGVSYVSGEPTTDDLNGHGTFCAGIIAARVGNGSPGMAGAFFDSSKVRILPVKVLGSCGSGNTSDLVAGIAYAVGRGARVINLSIQSPDGSEALETAVNDARRNGVLVVAAAGNHNHGTSYPAVYSQVMAVGALDHLGNRAYYSDYGKLEISAPGGDGAVRSGGCTSSLSCCLNEIWSLADLHPSCGIPTDANYNPPCPSPSGGGASSYDFDAGTSFAAPLVAAAAALLFSQDPGRRVEDVQRILMQTASATALGAGYNPETGWGKLNFYGALTYQGSAQPGAPIKAYNWPNPFSPDKDGLTTLTFFLPGAAATTVRLLDAGGDLVRRWDLDASQAAAGMNLIAWDGHNGVGAVVANGAYTLVVQCGGARATATVAVLR